MNTFILLAHAQDATAPGQQGVPQGSPLDILFLFVPIFLIFYFMIIRPNNKRQAEHQKMIEALKKGDDVVTAGGIMGSIADVREGHFTVKIADNVRVKVTRGSVVSRVVRDEKDQKEKS